MQIFSRIGLFYGIILIVCCISSPVIAADLTADEYYNQGTNLVNLGKYNEAISSFDNALRIKPNDYEAWYNRGMAYAKLVQYNDAIASFDKALQIKPDYYGGWYNRGTLYVKLGQYNDALISYDKAVKIEPENPDAWGGLGTAYLNLGRYDEAVASFDKALKINPNTLLAQKNRELALKLKTQTLKAPLIYAPFGAIAIMVALFVWQRSR